MTTDTTPISYADVADRLNEVQRTKRHLVVGLDVPRYPGLSMGDLINPGDQPGLFSGQGVIDPAAHDRWTADLAREAVAEACA